MLLTQPIDKDEGRMPSPSQLKRKFIIKHKKLPEGSEVGFSRIQEDNGPDIDISNAVKNGILYLEDPIDKVSPNLFHRPFLSHLFVDECTCSNRWHV
jgi:phosphatidylinositol phospholipase C gamma-1